MTFLTEVGYINTLFVLKVIKDNYKASVYLFIFC